MAQNFLSDLKMTLDNCIAELDEIHFMFCQNPATDFDFLNKNCTCYDIQFRIVRILLDNGTYICIATNLPEEEFSLDEIKKLYRMKERGNKFSGIFVNL